MRYISLRMNLYPIAGITRPSTSTRVLSTNVSPPIPRHGIGYWVLYPQICLYQLLLLQICIQYIYRKRRNTLKNWSMVLIQYHQRYQIPLNGQIFGFLFFYWIISGKEDNYPDIIQIIVGL